MEAKYLGGELNWFEDTLLMHAEKQIAVINNVSLTNYSAWVCPLGSDYDPTA